MSEATSNPSPLKSLYQQYIHISKYSRWIESQKERESWPETVERYMSVLREHIHSHHNHNIPDEEYTQLRDSIINLEIMPSMRALMTAGTSLLRDNTCAYNCAYVAVEDIQVFSEIMFILMSGCGVGFSVERQYISKLPAVPKNISMDTTDPIVVEDSKEGWADALCSYIRYMYKGLQKNVDVSLIRPYGSKLKTFGGRASGPEPFVKLLRFIADVFKRNLGHNLPSIDVHDIVCMICDSVVAGGVRRSAAISLSNLSDDRMRHAKDGRFFETHPYRAFSNNSVAYTERPDVGIFMKEWLSLYESKSGERGIFNRVAAKKQAARNGRRDWESHEFGSNPCSEIILRSSQMCNLTEVIVRASDTPDTITEKIRKATVLGTYQSTFTYFPYLREKWTKNAEEERLLGVSLTGIMDNQLTNGSKGKEKLASMLDNFRNTAITTNSLISSLLSINRSTAITCVKPSGTVSQLVDSSSGIHARYSPFYIRRVRSSNSDPLTQYMIENKFPYEKAVYENNTTIFKFPMKSPTVAIFKDDRKAIEQLRLWKLYQDHWCEHKPSITVNVGMEEWPEVGAWVWNHFDDISGVAFLPASESDHIYPQMPYEEITKNEYKKLISEMPNIVNWKGLSQYENEDHTKSSQTFACVGNTCEYVDN